MFIVTLYRTFNSHVFFFFFTICSLQTLIWDAATEGVTCAKAFALTTLIALAVTLMDFMDYPFSIIAQCNVFIGKLHSKIVLGSVLIENYTRYNMCYSYTIALSGYLNCT